MKNSRKIKSKHGQKSQRRNPNREYKRKIRALVKLAASGNSAAEKALRYELEKSTTAVWVLKHMIKIGKSKGQKLGDASSAIRRKDSIQKGNAFKPYQGGLPSLGKKK